MVRAVYCVNLYAGLINELEEYCEVRCVERNVYLHLKAIRDNLGLVLNAVREDNLIGILARVSNVGKGESFARSAKRAVLVPFYFNRRAADRTVGINLDGYGTG